MTIIVNLLLYGSESWCLTEKLLHRLNCFHNRCIRSMCRVTKRQTWLHKIDSDTLRRRLKLEKMEYYISLRKLRWAGHLARMPMTRLPRQFLTSWVNHPRPHGRPQYTYGHSLNKSLKRAGIRKTVYDRWPLRSLRSPHLIAKRLPLRRYKREETYKSHIAQRDGSRWTRLYLTHAK